MRSLLVAAALLLPLAAAAQQKRAFTPTDWYRLTTVSSPAMSPDGQRVAFTVTTAREAENRRHSEVWVGPHRWWRAGALHLTQYGKLQPALVSGRPVPVLHLEPAGRQGQHLGPADGPTGRRSA